MKTFKDLKPGDKIYYWDKGKLHEQTVHEATIETETLTNTYWDGSTQTRTREVLHLIAGKNRRTNEKLYYFNYTSLRFGCMQRFSCFEAAVEWMKRMQSHYVYKVQRLERRLNSYKNCVDKYTKAIEDAGE